MSGIKDKEVFSQHLEIKAIQGSALQIVDDTAPGVTGKFALQQFLDKAYQGYKMLALDLPTVQFNYIKTYISVSSILMGAFASVISYYKLSPKFVFDALIEFNLSGYLLGIILLFLGLLLAFIVFYLAIGLLSEKDKYPIPFIGMETTLGWVKENRNRVKSDEELEIKAVEMLLKPAAEAIQPLIDMIQKRAKKLKQLRLMTVLAAALGVLGSYLTALFQ